MNFIMLLPLHSCTHIQRLILSINLKLDLVLYIIYKAASPSVFDHFDLYLKGCGSHSSGGH